MISNLIQPMAPRKVRTLDELSGAFQQHDYPIIVQPKVDGICAIRSGDTIHTRSGKPVKNDMLRQRILDELPAGAVCELWVPVTEGRYEADFAKATSLVNSVDKDSSEVKITIFDIALSGIFAGRRLGVAYENAPRCTTVSQLAMNERELLQAVNEYMELGAEGAVIKPDDAFYKFARVTPKENFSVAYKPYLDDEAVVIDCFEQMENTNEAGQDAYGYTERSSHGAGKAGKNTLGGFICRGVSGAFKGVEFKVGGMRGITAAERKNLWQDADNCIGRVFSYEHQGCGAKDKPRQPIFIRWRELK